jgi:hypothetical protein
MKEFTLPSGATLKVDIASYKVAKELRRALLLALKDSPLGDVSGLDIKPEDLQKGLGASGKESLSGLVKIVLSVMTSREVEKALQSCYDKALYCVDNVDRRMDITVFDDSKLAIQAREDHDMIHLRIAEVNCAPFFRLLLSKFSQLAKTKQSTPELKSPAQTSAS